MKTVLNAISQVESAWGKDVKPRQQEGSLKSQDGASVEALAAHNLKVLLSPGFEDSGKIERSPKLRGERRNITWANIVTTDTDGIVTSYGRRALVTRDSNPDTDVHVLFRTIEGGGHIDQYRPTTAPFPFLLALSVYHKILNYGGVEKYKQSEPVKAAAFGLN